MDRVLPGATIPGQSRPGSNGDEGVVRIPQSPSITGTSPSDCLVSYPGHSLGGSYPSAKEQSVYFTAPAYWVTFCNILTTCDNSAVPDAFWPSRLWL